MVVTDGSITCQINNLEITLRMPFKAIRSIESKYGCSILGFLENHLGEDTPKYSTLADTLQLLAIDEISNVEAENLVVNNTREVLIAILACVQDTLNPQQTPDKEASGKKGKAKI